MKKPNPEQLERLRIRVAELCQIPRGFLLIKRGAYWRPDAKGYTMQIEQAGIYSEEYAHRICDPSHGEVTMAPAPVTNYPEDLNACHDAITRLTEIPYTRQLFEDHLLQICNPDHDRLAKDWTPEQWSNGFHAEAWQRCIALDRTLSEHPIL